MSISGLGSGMFNNFDILKYQNAVSRNANNRGNKAESLESNPESNHTYGLEGISDNNGFESKLKRAMEQKDEKALKEACLDLEEIFIRMMYKQMKATVSKSDLVSDSAGTEIIDSMFDETLMKEACQSKGIGLADMMYKQLYKQMNNVYKKNVAEE